MARSVLDPVLPVGMGRQGRAHDFAGDPYSVARSCRGRCAGGLRGDRHFKQINDLHGHLVGDMYLRHAAMRMKQQLRPGDMLARLGGDEFVVVVLSVPGRAETEEIARRLGACFEETFTLGHYEIRGSASIGIALCPEDGGTRDSLLSAADSAMYVAKHLKRQVDAGVDGTVWDHS